MRKIAKSFRPNTISNDEVEITYINEENEAITKRVSRCTKIQKLPEIFLNNNTFDYLICLNGQQVSNIQNTLIYSPLKILVTFFPKFSIKCTLFTIFKKSNESIFFDQKIINELFKNNPNDKYIFFSTDGQIITITEKNYFKMLKNDENYYVIRYPAIFEKKRKSLISKQSFLKKKKFIWKIIDYLESNFSDLQLLLCILYKIDQIEALKKKFTRYIKKKVANNGFSLLFAVSNLFFTEQNESLVCREYFIPLLISFQDIINNSKSINQYIELFNEIDHSDSPFKIINLPDLFFINIAESKPIIQLDRDTFGVYLGESDSLPNQPLYYDPLNGRKANFHYTDYFLKETDESQKINFEDLFFDMNEFIFTNKKIGSGAYGCVVLANRVSDGMTFAAKVVNEEKTFNKFNQMQFMRESMVLQKLNHPSIVDFVGINFQSYENTKELRPTIITEYLENSSLDNLFRNNLEFTKWDTTKRSILLIGIANAMRYLHRNGIIHRDLKPGNILIDNKGHPKICDFGCSKCLTHELTQSIKLIVSYQAGTPTYLAPEMIESENYGPGVDVYSFSILAYEIISGKEAFLDLKKKKINSYLFMKAVIEGKRPELDDSFTDKMKKLLQSCWSKNIYDRPTFEVIFNELSNDFSYFKGKINKKAINKYINEVRAIPDPSTHVIFNTIKIDIKEVDNLFFELNEFKITENKLETDANSTIYLAKRIVDNKEFSACVIHTSNFNENEQMILIRESLMLQKLMHPFITKFCGLNISLSRYQNIIEPIIISEYVPKYSWTNGNDLSETQKWFILLGIAHAMSYIHKNGFYHGFLCPENISIDDNYFPRIRFPYLFSVNNQNRESIISYMNLFHYYGYIAPELLESQIQFGKEIDTYSFSIFAYELLMGKPAFECKRNGSISFHTSARVVQGERPTFPDSFPENIQELLIDCWGINVYERPSFDNIYAVLYDHLNKNDENKEIMQKFKKKINEDL